MRRALNILQAAAAAEGVPAQPAHAISEDTIYACTGNAHPRDIHAAFRAMLQDEFATALHTVHALRTARGIAPMDLLTGMYELVMALELPPHARAFLLDHMSQIEYRLATGASERIQLSALLGAVKAAVDLSQIPP